MSVDVAAQDSTQTSTRTSKVKRRLMWAAAAVVAMLLVLFGGGLWFASNQLLSPAWRGVTKDLSVCEPETEKHWGEDCGNLRDTGEFSFREVKVPAVGGYDLPGWMIGTAANKLGPAKGAIMLVHSGGSDRREETRYVRYFLEQGLDVLTFDLGCHGEAPCPVPGMTYGHRESRDVLSAYLYLTETYGTVYAMGTSVGAAAILIALPEMPKLAGVVADSAMVSFQRLIKEAPESESMPGWGTDLLIKVSMLRGRFDGQLSALTSLRLSETTPILFVHSRHDEVVSYRQTEELAAAYAGPKTVWLAEKGSHAAIWDADTTGYKKRLSDFLRPAA